MHKRIDIFCKWNVYYNNKQNRLAVDTRIFICYNIVRKAKRSAIRTNIGSCIGALGVLAPSIMLISRKLGPESEYQVKKDIEAKLVKEQSLNVSKLKS